MLDNDRLTKHLFTLDNLTPHELLAITFIASQRNRETFWCRPTQKQICAKVGKSRFWLQCFIGRMRKRKILADIPFREVNSKFIVHEYWFLFDLETVRQELAMWPPGFKRKRAEDSLSCITYRLNHLIKRENDARTKSLLQAASHSNFD